MDPVDPKQALGLLAGFLQCACGARFEAVRRGRTKHNYMCAARRRKGPSACPSEVSLPVADIEQTFLDVIEGTVLHPDFIDRVVDAAFASRPDDERSAIMEERCRLVREIQHLTAAIANGADIPALVAALSERDRQLKAVSAKLARPVVEPLDREVLRAALKLREGQWKQVLRGPHIAQARLVLQHLIDLPIHVMNTPRPSYIKAGTQGTERIPTWGAHTRPGGLLTGLVQKLASPIYASWNQLYLWIRAVDGLRRAA
jgi:hypothetical protein